MNATGNILLYDGKCNLCDRMVSFIIRHDKSKLIKFSSLQSDTGRSILTRYGLMGNHLKSVVYIREYKYYLRSSAVLNIFRDLGGRWSLLYGLIIIPAFFRDIFYFLIASTRYRIFGKRVLCAIPDTDFR